MKLMYLEVLLEKGYLLEPREQLGEPCSFLEIAGVIKSFLSLGYILNKESIEKLRGYNLEELTEFYHKQILISTIKKKSLWNHVSMIP